MINWIDTIE